MANFNALHTALEAAINLILPCAEINLVMQPNYEVVQGAIVGANYRVECRVPATQNPQPLDILVSFDTPTLREDGSALDGNDIAGYEVEMSSGCVRARTIADIDKPSEYTETICP